MSLTVAAACLAASLVIQPASGAPRPVVHDFRCVERCAGPRAAAAGATVAFHGEHLGRITEVRLRGDSTRLIVAPESRSGDRVTATVPGDARSGRPRLAQPNGRTAAAHGRLRIVPGGRVPEHLRLSDAVTRPREAFFDGRRKPRFRFRFTASGRTSIRIRLVRVATGTIVAGWRKRDLLPFLGHAVRWNGLERDGDVADDGTYRFRVREPAGRWFGGGRFRLRGEKFPVRGSHRYGGGLQRFGAPRSGGRTHQGQDVMARCGTPLAAARGGRVQLRAYSDALYGHYLVIDGRGTRTDYFYAHMPRPSPMGRGARVRTGERVGAVGKTGNARTTPCHLHFELWPHGWRRGGPMDPLPQLRRWDGWS